jgi:hypothetical protein
MVPNLVGTRRIVTVVAIALIAVGVLLGLWYTRGRAPETEEIARAISPGGTWTAKVEMVVYGDHHFVNDARYEVRIGRVGSKDQEVLVYSVQASGPIGTTIEWRANEELIIQDTLSLLAGAVKRPHPAIKIEYRPL